MEGVAPEKGSRAEKRAKVSRGGSVSARTGLPFKNFGMNIKARPKRKGAFVRGKVLEAECEGAVLGRLVNTINIGQPH